MRALRSMALAALLALAGVTVVFADEGSDASVPPSVEQVEQHGTWM